jgi:hypothetical protein
MLQNDGTPTFSIMLKLSDYMSDLPQEEQEVCKWELMLFLHHKLYENLLIFGSSHERHEAYMQHLYLNWGTCHVRLCGHGQIVHFPCNRLSQSFKMTGVVWLTRVCHIPWCFLRPRYNNTRENNEQYVKHQQAVDVLNEELDCAGEVFISCEGCKAAMDMVKLTWGKTWDEEKCGCIHFHMKMVIFRLFSFEFLFGSCGQFLEHIRNDFIFQERQMHTHGLPWHQTKS